MRPGVQVLSREAPPARSAPTDTGGWFVAGLSERGSSVEPVTLRGMSDYARHLGDRVTYGALYDALDTYFREGGSTATVARVVGPAAAAAFVDLMDGATTPAPSIRVTASSPGDWGNSLRAAVVAGATAGTFILVISHATDGELERSPELADRAAAATWSAQSRWVDVTERTSTLDPAVVAATALAGGTDDRAAITDTQWTDALARFTEQMGPGQVSMPGRTTAAAHQAQLDHAAARNRVALLDGPDTTADATLRTTAAAVRTSVNARYGGLFAPWATIPGILAGTTRTVPYSAVQAGLIARSDASNSANVPAAGANGQARYAIGLTAAWDDATREDLNEAGVNIARELYGGIRTYGYRTLVDPVAAPAWLGLGNARLNMAIVARAGVIAQRYVFAQLDGRGRKIAQFAGELDGMLLDFYEQGSLYGDTPADAFAVETGDQVNTPESIAAGELRAVLSVRMSPFAELVVIEIVKIAITEEVPA